jgi:hypothetical protein
MQFGGRRIDAQANAPLGALTTDLAPGGHKPVVRKELLKQPLAILCRQDAWSPGQNIGAEHPPRELLLAVQSHLDRIATFLASQKTDLQIRIGRLDRHQPLSPLS